MRITVVAAIALAFAAGLVYHGPSETWLVPLVGIPWLLLAFWLLPSGLGRADPLRTGVLAGGGAPLAWLMLAWLAWLAAGMLWSAWPVVSWWYFLILAWYPLAFLVLLRFPDRIPALWNCLLVLAAVGVGYGLVESVVTGDRADSLFIDPNSFAALVNLLLFASLGELWLSGGNKRRRLLLAGLVVLLAAALVLTRSRGAWIAFAGGAVLTALVLWCFGRQLARKPLWTGLGSVGLGLLAGSLLLGANDVLSRAESVAEAGHARWLIWQSTVQMIAEHGWLGTGLGSFALLYPQFRSPLETGTTGFMAHNDYLQFALETGLPGLLLFIAITLAIFWLFLRYCFRRAEDTADGLATSSRVAALLALIAVLTAHAHALVNFIFYETAITVAAGAVLALAVVRLGLAGQRDDHAASLPRFHPAAAFLCLLLSLGLVVDAGMGWFFNANKHRPQPLSGPRYQAALALSTFYPFNTTATSYVLTAQVARARASTIAPVKSMAEDMAINTAHNLLAHKARDCMAQTVLASFPVKGLQRNGVEQAAAFEQAQAKLVRTIRQFPLCIPPYLVYADLLQYRDRDEKALDVLLSAIQRFDTRVPDEGRRLFLLEQAGRLAAHLGKPKLATGMALSLRANNADNDWAQQYLDQWGS